MNGHTVDLGLALGQMMAEGRRHTEILLDINRRLIDLPERIELLAERRAGRPAAAPIPASSTTSSTPALSERLALLRQCLWAGAAALLLASVVAGKVTWPEALPLLRSLAGIP